MCFPSLLESQQWISYIYSDETGIEQLKKEKGSWGKKSRLNSLKEVFGQNPSIRWLSPFHPTHTSMGKRELYLYTV